MATKKSEEWMRKAVNPKDKGELHKKLDVPADEKIPTSLLKKKKKELQARAEGDKKLTKAERELLGQIQFALNARKAELLADLTKTANALDESGLRVAADHIDGVLHSIVETEEFLKNAATLPNRRMSLQALKAREALPILSAAQGLDGAPENAAALSDAINSLKKLK